MVQALFEKNGMVVLSHDIGMKDSATFFYLIHSITLNFVSDLI